MPALLAFERLRASLHAGTGICEALAAAASGLDLDALTYFARWRPAHAHDRIFDTRFYLARLPADAPLKTKSAA